MKVAKIYVDNNGWLSGFFHLKNGTKPEFYFSLDTTKAMPLNFDKEDLENYGKMAKILQLTFLNFHGQVHAFWEEINDD